MKTLYFLILLLFCLSGNSQVNDVEPIPLQVKIDKTSGLQPVKFDRKKIEKFRASEEFQYMNIEERDNWWTRFKRWINHKYNQFLSWLFGEYEPGGILAFFISIVPYILIIGLLVLVVWIFSKMDPGTKILKKPASMEVYLSEEEELIKNEDLDSLITQAKNKQDYRLAVRYQYLKALRRLNELHVIEYQHQKTNKEYIQEIFDGELKALFSDITSMYEFIWYGNFKVSRADYQLAETGFNKIDHRIKPAGDE